MKHPFLIGMLGLLSSVAIAQTDTCISNLKNAGTDYDQGNYDQAITTLNYTLIGCNLSKQDQIQANKLLILSYLGVDNLEAANNTAANIMKIDPTYTPDKFKDDPRLSALFEKFKPEPTLMISAGGGINFPEINVEKTYSVVHPDDQTGLATYESLINYQLYAGAEKRAYKDLWIAAGFQYRNTSYNHILDSVDGNTIHYNETLSYIDLPLSVKYYFLKKSVQPFLQAGADFSFLLRALSTTSRGEEQDIVDRTALRNTFQVGWFGAAGVNYSIKAFRIFVNAQYTFFPDLINKDGTRYADEINLYKYYYVDDDFKMNNLQFNAGLSYVLTYKVIQSK